MKLKNLSEKILNNIKSKGFKFIELDSVIETNHIVERSGENFRRFIFSFSAISDDEYATISLDASILPVVPLAFTPTPSEENLAAIFGEEESIKSLATYVVSLSVFVKETVVPLFFVRVKV